MGAIIKFVDEDEGHISGLFGKIAENVLYERIIIEYLGEIVDGQEDMTSDEAWQWNGAQETYIFTEIDGVTTLTVELEGEGVKPEMSEMFEQMWPAALNKLKEIAER